MKKVLVGFLLLATLLMTHCGKPTNEEFFHEVQVKLNNIDSYSCRAEIKVIGNISTQKYEMKQMFKLPDKYILEVIEPEESRGFKTIFNGKKICIYHPDIDQSFLLDDYKSANEDLFIGFFLKTLNSSEHAVLGEDIFNGKEYLTIEVEIPGNNKYRRYKKLWVDKGNFQPKKMVIYDNNKEKNYEVLYYDFKYDINLSDDDFCFKAL